MNVTLRHVVRFDDIFADESFKQLAARFVADRSVRAFVTGVVRTYLDDRVGAWNSISMYATLWGASHQHEDERALAGIADAGQLLETLYTRHGPSRLRGALLEGMVRACLEGRYVGESLEDNAFVKIRNGVPYDSPTDIDAAAWHDVDQVGECHDCKARASWIDRDLVENLDTKLPRPEFKVGVVTTDSRFVVLAQLKAMNVRISKRTRIISLEALPDFAPLQTAPAA